MRAFQIERETIIPIVFAIVTAALFIFAVLVIPA
jgi:hypothetical protein